MRKQIIIDYLSGIGEDPLREGLRETPARVSKSTRELFRGYRADVPKLFEKTFPVGQYEGLVVVRRIKFVSHCEHHLLPFYGHVDIAYLPNKKILGLSKFARVVDALSRRLQLQEQLTQEIADAIRENLDCRGVLVRTKAVHFCMLARGVETPDSDTVTTSLSGWLKDDAALLSLAHNMLDS